MLKNIFSGILGCLVGIVIMGIIVFILQTQDRLDWMPLIMLACVAILILIGLCCYYFSSARRQKVQKAAKK